MYGVGVAAIPSCFRVGIPILATFGERARQIRISRKLNQELVAARMNEYLQQHFPDKYGPDDLPITQSTVSQIEKGRNRNPSEERQRALAYALDVQPSAFYTTQSVNLPLDLSGEEVPISKVLTELWAMSADRPDLQETLRMLEETNTEVVYHQALRILHRHMVAGLETVRDLFLTDKSGSPNGR
jgi:transcriptional regulator with XRE-family HTH domain